MSRHFIILGAGISGLTIGWFLKKHLQATDKLTILEQSNRVGGWIKTKRDNNFLFEQGARSCRTSGSGQETLALVEQLNLCDQMITPQNHAKKRYLLFNDQLTPVPQHLWEIPFNPLTKGWLKVLWKDWMSPKKNIENESIKDFFDRRIGPEWTNRLIDPLVTGIYAGDCQALSLQSCFPLFKKWETEFGSFMKANLQKQEKISTASPFITSLKNIPLFSFRDGMETLPKTLGDHLKSFIKLETEVKQIHFKSNEIKINLRNHPDIIGTHLISTIPFHHLANVVPQLNCFSNQLSYSTVIVVNMGWNQSFSSLDGFGYLIPSMYQTPILGCVWDSAVFPQQNSHLHQTRLGVMLGGVRFPKLHEYDDRELTKLALQSVKHHLKIHVSPDAIQIHRAIHAIPQYGLLHEQWKKDVRHYAHKLSPCFHISGNGFDGISINDCIKNAEQFVIQCLL